MRFYKKLLMWFLGCIFILFIYSCDGKPKTEIEPSGSKKTAFDTFVSSDSNVKSTSSSSADDKSGDKSGTESGTKSDQDLQRQLVVAVLNQTHPSALFKEILPLLTILAEKIPSQTKPPLLISAFGERWANHHEWGKQHINPDLIPDGYNVINLYVNNNSMMTILKSLLEKGVINRDQQIDYIMIDQTDQANNAITQIKEFFASLNAEHPKFKLVAHGLLGGNCNSSGPHTFKVLKNFIEETKGNLVETTFCSPKLSDDITTFAEKFSAISGVIAAKGASCKEQAKAATQLALSCAPTINAGISIENYLAIWVGGVSKYMYKLDDMPKFVTQEAKTPILENDLRAGNHVLIVQDASDKSKKIELKFEVPDYDKDKDHVFDYYDVCPRHIEGVEQIGSSTMGCCTKETCVPDYTNMSTLP